MANPNPSPATRFRPGRSGTPGGTARDPLTGALREQLTDEALDAIVGALIALARAGSLEAIEMIWDRLEGKVAARQETGDPGAFNDLADVPSEELIRRIKVIRSGRYEEL
jgi:hypothetical protein